MSQTRAEAHLLDAGFAKEIDQGVVGSCIENPWKDSRARVRRDTEEETKGMGKLEAAERMERMRKDLSQGVHGSPMMRLGDIDGDGLKEWLYMWNPWGSNFAAVQYLYLSGHGCKSFAGVFLTGPELGSYLKVLEEKEGGMPVIQTYSINGCAGWARTVTWHRWSSEEGVYVSRNEVDCPCPDHDPDHKGGRAPTTLVRHPACLE